MTDEDFRLHYAEGVEAGRMGRGSSSIEFERTKELLQRFLPSPPAAVLDVGGGPGIYAAWLASRGYRVHLVDAVPLHVEQAKAAASTLIDGFTVALGDARDLSEKDASYDAVLLLGPLYHLTKRTERVRALAEGRRVVRPGGVVIAAAISRFASLFDGVAHGYLDDPEFDAIVERDLREGQHRNPSGRPEWFTTAYFHRPEELPEEIDAADLELVDIFGIEGPAAILLDLIEDATGRQRVLRAAREIEREPSLLGLSDHLLVVGRRRPS